jgi:hypothetical protein
VAKTPTTLLPPPSEHATTVAQNIPPATLGKAMTPTEKRAQRVVILKLLSLLPVLALVLWPLDAAAQARITLGEIVPALVGTELGALEIADAPVPGATRVVRRADVLAVMREAGRSAEGLSIPSSTRITREGEHLDGDALTRLALPAIERTMAPCTVSDAMVRSELDLPTGDRAVEIGRPDRLESGAIAFQVVIRSAGVTSRLSAQARLSCPAPVVTPGSTVTARVRMGAVRVTAHGTCRQAGRPGDVIRVRIEETGALIDARVIDASTVEVVR